MRFILATAAKVRKSPNLSGKPTMRPYWLALPLAIAIAAPAAAQSDPALDGRIQKIEKELRAVQRKVFPGGAGMTVEPEINPTGVAAPSLEGAPATSAIADLTARVDAIEAQLRTLTGQAEQNAHRLNQIEQAISDLKAGMASAPPAPGPAAASSLPAAAPSGGPRTAASESEAVPPATGDPGEDAYTAGFRQWNQGQFAEAQKTLEAMVKQYPKHARASYAQNLLGRAYLDGGKPATAAKIFLANYQNNPKGDRAADSLYFLGISLTKLGKKPEACGVYDELQDVYGAGMRSWVKERVPAARKAAGCS
jgi:TolA-binding protein